jgi:beta-xylosidase
MDRNGEHLLPASDRIIHQSKGSEANKLYKIHGLYYHYFSEVHPEGRVAMMERAHSLEGPWQARQLIHVNAALDKEPNQGGLIQIPSGAWYFVTHQGTGDWEGRAAVLLPVTWLDGWPILGRPGNDGIGNMVWRAAKPITGFPRLSPWTSDDFAQATLRPEWEWNYQPRAGKWSLVERPGHLRLYAFPPLRKDDFTSAGNVLTQRVARTTRNEVTVCLDLQGLVEGQQAGLAHYAKTYSSIGVRRANGLVHIVVNHASQTTLGPEIRQPRLWLRSTWGFNGQSQFSYSLSGQEFHEFGPPYQLTWGAYRGDRVGLFTFNGSSDSGYVDFAGFSYVVAK